MKRFLVFLVLVLFVVAMVMTFILLPADAIGLIFLLVGLALGCYVLWDIAGDFTK